MRLGVKTPKGKHVGLNEMLILKALCLVEIYVVWHGDSCRALIKRVNFSENISYLVILVMFQYI